MSTLSATATPSLSTEFAELQSLFDSLAPPYGAGDIARFNQVYRRIYRSLNAVERCRAEEFVDELIAGLEREDLARRIFGVV